MACNRSGHEHQSAAVGRVLRVQASSFQERRVVTAPKRGCVLKVDLIDPKPFGFDSNEISTETENFTVLGVGV